MACPAWDRGLQGGALRQAQDVASGSVWVSWGMLWLMPGFVGFAVRGAGPVAGPGGRWCTFPCDYGLRRRGREAVLPGGIGTGPVGGASGCFAGRSLGWDLVLFDARSVGASACEEFGAFPLWCGPRG